MPTICILKNFIITFLDGENLDSRVPRCNHEEKFADKIPPRAPPFSRNAGISVKIPAICIRLSILVLKILPDNAPKILQKINTGIDSIKIRFE